MAEILNPKSLFSQYEPDTEKLLSQFNQFTGWFKQRFDKKLSRRQALRLFASLALTVMPPVHARILTFHEVPNPQTLADPVTKAIKEGFIPTDLDTVSLYINQIVPWPQPQPFVVATLDDGRLNQYDNAQRAVDIIRTETGFEVPLEFFVITRFEGIKAPLESILSETPSYKNTQDVVHMNKGHLISLAGTGKFRLRNHTHDHGILPRLSILDRNAQVEDGEAQVQRLYALAGISVASRPKQPAFAYPYGEYGGQTGYIGNRYALALSTRKTEFHYPWENTYLGRIPIT